MRRASPNGHTATQSCCPLVQSQFHFDSGQGNVHVLTKPADVTSDHGHLEQGRHAQHACDGYPVVVPGAQIVAKPFPDLVSGTRERRTGDDEGA